VVVFYDDTIAGSWPALIARLNVPDRGLARWRGAEPVLADVGRVDGQFDLQGYRRDRADAGLGALVRLAAADGGDDQDALVLLLHLLSGMVLSLARQLADLSPDIVTVIVSELTCQIRSYPWRRRTRAWAANLQADTRRAVLADLKPRHRYHEGARPLPCCSPRHLQPRQPRAGRRRGRPHRSPDRRPVGRSADPA